MNFCHKYTEWAKTGLVLILLTRLNSLMSVCGKMYCNISDNRKKNCRTFCNIFAIITRICLSANVTPSSAIICYRQHCSQRKAPVFKLLRGQFWGFSPRIGDTLHRWGWNLACTQGWTFGAPLRAKFYLPIGAKITKSAKIKRWYYLTAYRHIVIVLTSNITFLSVLF